MVIRDMGKLIHRNLKHNSSLKVVKLIKEKARSPEFAISNFKKVLWYGAPQRAGPDLWSNKAKQAALPLEAMGHHVESWRTEHQLVETLLGRRAELVPFVLLATS
jgi:hypothetical protein